MNEFTYRYMTNKGKKEHLKNGIYYKHNNVSGHFGTKAKIENECEH